MKTQTKFTKFIVTSAAGIGMLTLGACSTTSPTLVSNGAPITYKVDQDMVRQASLTTNYSGNMFASPSALPLPQSHPLPQALPQPVQRPTMPAPQAPKFDQSNVDIRLYSHQRIGKTYSILGKKYTPKHQPKYNQVGTASWYGDKFHGKLTANGETYDMNGITAAHKTLPLNSMVYVTNMETGKGMMVRINDRGPFVGGRIIDLSRETAQQLGLFQSGLGRVRVQYAGPADSGISRSAALQAPEMPKAVKPSPKLRAAPMPQPQAAPIQQAAPKAVQAPTPKSAAPTYRSLRDLGQAKKPEQNAELQMPAPAARPAPRKPMTPRAAPQPGYVNPLLGLQPLNPVAPNAADQSAGNPDTQTLTIKGRVHIVSDRNDGTQAPAVWTPAINYRNIPAK